MLRLIRPRDMFALEQRAFAAGVSSLALMELAAEAVCQELGKMLGGLQGKRVAFVCGSGNNDGDGLAAARLAHAQGALPFVLLPRPAATPDAIRNLERVQSLHIPILERLGQLPEVEALVDALFGIGLTRPLTQNALALVEGMNALKLPTLAVDIPSGMDALTGAVGTACVHATRTLSFQYFKPGHFLTVKPEALGELRCREIGLAAYADESVFIDAWEAQDLPDLLPKRPLAAHKGSCGRALLYCGSLGMAGAAAMAALGCLRAGAGLTKVVCDPAIIQVLQVLAPNATCIPLKTALQAVVPHDVLLAGCGLGQSVDALAALHAFYSVDRPAVLDADALNMLAVAPFALGRQTLLTPHVGEAARLLGCRAAEVTADLIAAAIAISQRYGAVTLLKSHCSVITDGGRVALNVVGSPALAKGGSGDALAGIITGLMAQGLPPFEAARLGSLWMGRAAQLAADRHGLLSVLTGDVLNLLGEAGKQ